MKRSRVRVQVNSVRAGVRAGDRRLGALVASIITMAVLSGPVAHAADWEIGDVAANTPDGPTAVKIFSNDGTFKEAIGKAGIGGEGTGCAFDANRDLFATFFQANQTVKFSSAHPHADLMTIDNPGTNESIVFDAAGNFYIGMADPDVDEFVRKYDPAGNLLDSYTNLATDRGADWIDLAADQRTLFYNGEGRIVRRYDLATHTQLPDFATIPGPGNAFALRLLPPGDGSGGVLVADGGDIKRLDGSGNVVQNYDAPGEGSWFALNLDPNGTSFWSAGIGSGNVFRFNIATGAIEVGPISAHPSEVAGLCVLGELTAAAPRADVSISKDAPAEAVVNENFTYELNVSNGGPDAASAVRVTDALPAGTEFVSATPSQGTCTGTTTVTCELGTIDNGATARVTIVVKPTAEGTVTNTATVSTESTDPNSANDSASATTTVGPAPPPPPPLGTCGLKTDRIAIDGVNTLGTVAADVLTGTARNDRFKAQAGNDAINGLEGRDCLLGNAGNDKMSGADGADYMRAGADDDKVKGGDGADNIKLQDGDDRLKAGPGDDRLKAQGRGTDRVDCGSGNDTLIADQKDEIAANCEKVKIVDPR